MKLHFSYMKEGTVLNRKILGGRPPPLPPLRRGPCSYKEFRNVLFVMSQKKCKCIGVDRWTTTLRFIGRKIHNMLIIRVSAS